MGFVRPPASFLVGVALMAFALVFEVVGLAAPGWCSMWVGEKRETMVGLWEYCYELPNFTCEDLERLWNVSGWVEACRAMGVLAVVVQGLCLIIVLLLCVVRQLPIFFAMTPWAALVAGLLVFVEFATFVGAVEREQNTLGRDFEYQYAFALTVVAFIFSLLASLAFFIGDARNRKSLEL